MPQQPEGPRSPLWRSSGWAIAEYAAYPALMIGAMPVYLWALGSIQFGQWMLMLTFTGFGGVAAFGMGPTATHDVAAARGLGQMEKAGDAARTCLALAVVCSILFAFLLASVGWVFAPAWFVKVGSPREIHLIVGFAALILTLEQIDSVFAGTLRGFERFDLSAKLEIGAKFSQLAVTVALAVATGTVVLVFAGSALVTIIRTIMKLRASRTLLGLVRFTPKWDLTGMREAFAFGKWIWLQSLGGLIFAAADRMLVGSLLGATSLGHYALVLQLAQQIQSIPSAGAQVLFPAMARHRHSGGDWRSLAIRTSFLVGGIGICAGLAFALAGPWFVELWVGRSVSESVAGLIPVLAAAYAMIALSSGPHHLLMGAGRAKAVAICSNLAGIVTIVVTIWAIGHYGLFGAALGRLAYGLVILALVPVLWQHIRRAHSVESLATKACAANG